MIVDIFTHVIAPKDAFRLDGVVEDSAFDHDKKNLQYLEELRTRALDSELALRIPSSENDTELSRIIPDSRTLRCYMVKREGRYIGSSGYVDKQDETKFRELLGKVTPNDEVRIHGAFYGICTTETAIQVYFLLYQNRFLHPEDSDYQDRIRELGESEVLATSNVSFGIVYKHHGPLPELAKLAKQLERPHTRIFE